MKKNYTITLFLFAMLVFNPSYAQYIQWQNTIGGSSNDYLYTVNPTSDGGYICGGDSHSNISGDKTENRVGGPTGGAEDYWVLKLNAAGNIQWQNTIGGTSRDVLRTIAQTSDGGYICGGSSMSNISGDKTENCLGWPDYWIVKLDASGNIQWQNTVGGDSTEELLSIAQSADGGYICGGTSYSGISGDKTENCLGVIDYWIVKLDSLGNLLWENTIGGSDIDRLNSVSPTADGGIICGGYSYSNISADKNENSIGAGDYWVVKLNGTGTIQWQNTIGGFGNDCLWSITQTTDGGFICGGQSQSGAGGDKTEPNMGISGDDYWVIKLDSVGNIQWQNTIGGSTNDYLYTVAETADNGFICGGSSDSNISGDKTENALGFQYDCWVVKLNVLGAIEWQNTIGGSIGEVFVSFATTADNGIICGGYTASNISADKTENCVGQIDYWLIKLTGQHNALSGTLFADLNNDNVHDSGEPGISNRRVDEIITGGFTFSRQNGDYDLAVLDTGNLSVAPLALNYFSCAPTQHNAYFTGINQVDSLNDFAFQPTSVINDLCVTITPPNNFRPGFNCMYTIHYENAGTTILAPTIIFFKDNFFTYVSSSLVPSIMAADSIVWNLPALAPFQQGNISVTLNVNTGTPVGTFVHCYARIEPIAGDANPSCNIGAWETPLVVTGSYDPNEIIVNRDILSTSELAASPFLQYIIYFQNTGNDTAFTVRVEDVLPVSLNASTMELMALSHSGHVQYEPLTRKVIFQFNNILLPDSNANEPSSHGYIHYRIKPVTTLIAGDTIKNQAGIYFDFNAPVMTNIVHTHVVLLTGTESEMKNNSVLIYPNPVADELTVQNVKFKVESVEVWDVVGRNVVLPLNPLKGTFASINVSELNAGIYFVKVRDEKGNVAVGKFVKE